MHKLSITMAGNKSLHAASKAKEDEFYTELSDIEHELRYYRQHFRGKVVFCNCDDPYESNFFKYFAMNFNQLGLKKLIATCYEGSPIADTQMSIFDEEHPNLKKTKVPHKIVITEVTDLNGDGAINLSDVEYLLQNDKNVLTQLEGTGDFRSNECVELMKETDIIVTNPPFSLFREFVAQLIQYKKQFLIIGNQNAITYKEIFTYIKTNQLWLGSTLSFAKFRVPEYYEPRATRFWVDENGQKWRSMGNICWFTNLDIAKRHEELDLYEHYSPKEYPNYDNYKAINVNKVSEIPIDYDGVMGVPITFLDKYNPKQFEILGIMASTTIDEINFGYPYVDGKKIYARILIRRCQK